MVPDSPVIVGPSPPRILGKLLLASAAITAGAAVISVVVGFVAVPPLLANAEMITAVTAAVLACFTVIAMSGATFGRRPRVEVGPEGFDVRGIVGHRFRRWGDVDGDFAVVKGRWQAAVAYRLSNAVKASTPVQPPAGLAGYDEAIAICGELTIGARQLADLLNRWKRGEPAALQT